jgi:type IV secretion system protein VirD4
MPYTLSTNQNTYRILAAGETASNNTWKTGLNNNDLVIGSTGAGKTRSYVKPNLLQENESFIVTDTKGLLVKEVAPSLKRHGYRIIHIDFTDPGSSYGYNPLDFIRYDAKKHKYNEQDILKIAEALCPSEDFIQPFWDYAARMYIEALIGYVLECLPKEEHTLEYVLKLQSAMNTTTDALLNEQLEENPDSFAARKYASFKETKNAEKMHSSILGIIAEKLDPLTFDGAVAMYSRTSRINFRDIAKKKTAVFLTVSDTDRSADRLVSLFYAQALQELCSFADKEGVAGTLPVPVRLYLDDFATNCRIPDFDKIISVIRSRGISVSIILQSLTQLTGLYGEACGWTIVNGCDHVLYLGGQDRRTAEYVSFRAGKTIDTVMSTPIDTGYLFRRGQKPKQIKPYSLKTHPHYAELEEAASAGSRSRRHAEITAAACADRQDSACNEEYKEGRENL